MFRKALLTSLTLLLSSHAVMAAKPRVVPAFTVKTMDSQTGQPMQGVTVALLVKRNMFTSYDPVIQVETDGNGRASIASHSDKRIGWCALLLLWAPPGLPERHLIYEIDLQKGRKVDGRVLMEPGKSRASYVLDGSPQGNCANLFTSTVSDHQIDLVAHLPRTYLECEDLGVDHARVDQIGQRDINKGTLNYYNFEADRRMGGQFFNQLSSTGENPPLKDPLVVHYVEDLVTRIARASDMPNLDFTVTVIDADVMNAFAVPGGYIFVYRGLIEQTETEAELAGVIAHEIAHVTSRHGTEGVTSAINKVVLATLVGEYASKELKGKKPWLRELAQITVMGGTQFWIIGGTRKREAEADFLGAQYAYRAGFDPHGIATLFERWSQQRGKEQTRLDQLFSDHPNDMARVQHVAETAGFFLPPRGDLIVSSESYHAVKAHLKQLPRPVVKGKAAADALFSSFKNTNESILYGEIEAYFEAEGLLKP